MQKVFESFVCKKVNQLNVINLHRENRHGFYTPKVVMSFTPAMLHDVHSTMCRKCHAFSNSKHEESFPEQTRRKGMIDYAGSPKYTIPSGCITFNKSETYGTDSVVIE